MNLKEKYNSLKQVIRPLGKVLIAYSGGVDSTFLLKTAVDTLGADNVLACINTGFSLPQSQYKRAVELAKKIGVQLVTVELNELADSNYVANKADRCFHCKSHLYETLVELAREKGFQSVASGSNLDDKDDFRPGNRAAHIFGIKTPLMDARLTKDDIRRLSRQLGLPTADVPASPCLASRIAYGLEITDERLEQVEQAEEFLKTLGFVEFRVRHHGDIARIEVPAGQIENIGADDMREKIVDKLKSLGFRYVTLDLEGFRSGSLNETLTEQEKRRNA